MPPSCVFVIASRTIRCKQASKRVKTRNITNLNGETNQYFVLVAIINANRYRYNKIYYVTSHLCRVVEAWNFVLYPLESRTVSNISKPDPFINAKKQLTKSEHSKSTFKIYEIDARLSKLRAPSSIYNAYTHWLGFK